MQKALLRVSLSQSEVSQQWFSAFSDSLTGKTAVICPVASTIPVSLCTMQIIVYKSNYY